MFLVVFWFMIDSFISNISNRCSRRISYALVEQVQQERIFYPFVSTPEAWEVEEPEGLKAFFHLMPGMAANLFK